MEVEEKAEKGYIGDQNIPLRHKDDSELKAVEEKQTEHGLSAVPPGA